MQGSVRKRGSTWSYRFRDQNGKQIEKGGFKKKGDASTALRKTIEQYEKNGFMEKKITFEQFTIEWMEGYVKKLRKQSTYDRYNGLVKKYLYPYIGNRYIGDIKSIHIEKILHDNIGKVSNSTLQSVYTIANTIFNRAVKTKTISQNPCYFVERPRRDKFVAETLTVEEVKIVLKELDISNPYDYMYFIGFSMALELGLRRGEICGMEWADVDFNKNTIIIRNNLVYTNGKTVLETPKTPESIRKLYISNYLKGILKSLLVKQKKDRLKYGEFYKDNIFEVNGIETKVDLVMKWEDGRYVHPLYLTSKTSKILKRCGIDKRVRFHDIRHTNATLLLEQGVDFKTLQKRLGHKNISTTLDIYTNVSQKMQQDATKKLRKILEE